MSAAAAASLSATGLGSRELPVLREREENRDWDPEDDDSHSDEAVDDDADALLSDAD